LYFTYHQRSKNLGTECVLPNLVLSGNSTRLRAIMLEQKVLDLSEQRFQNAQQLIAEVELKRTQLINGDLNLPKTP
jgi:hypothetical protein